MNERWQVFNPFTGSHEEFDQLIDAQARLLDVATKVLHMHTPRINRAVLDDNGDATWEQTNEHRKLFAQLSDEPLPMQESEQLPAEQITPTENDQLSVEQPTTQESA